MPKSYKYVSYSSHKHKGDEMSSQTSSKRHNTNRLFNDDDDDDEYYKRKHEKRHHANDEEDSTNFNSGMKGTSFLDQIINLVKKITAVKGNASKLFNEFLSSNSNTKDSPNFSDIGSKIFSLLSSSGKGTDNKDPFASFSILGNLFKNSPMASNLFSGILNNMASPSSNASSSFSSAAESLDPNKLQDALSGFKNILNTLGKN